MGSRRKKIRQSPTRRRSPFLSCPWRYLMSPLNGLVSISSIAARTRARSRGGMRSSDFRAGPARTTSQGFFSAEFIKGYVVTPLDRSLATANGVKLGRRGQLFREPARPKIGPECLAEKLRARPILPLHCFLNLLRHLARQRNGNSSAGAHKNWVLTGNTSLVEYQRNLNRQVFQYPSDRTSGEIFSRQSNSLILPGPYQPSHQKPRQDSR